jgi:hypothetical protein
MKFLNLILLVGLSSAAFASSAQVWKCDDAGRTVFSDVPCPQTGRQLDARSLNGNTMQADIVALNRSADAGTGPRSQAQGESAASICPSEQDIRNLETQASSITLRVKAQQFMDDEVRRARQCRKGQGHYTAADWALIREAHDDQNSIGNQRRARARAEAVHSAADPAEGERIERRRLYEEAFRKRRAEVQLRQD